MSKYVFWMMYKEQFGNVTLNTTLNKRSMNVTGRMFFHNFEQTLPEHSENDSCKLHLWREFLKTPQNQLDRK